MDADSSSRTIGLMGATLIGVGAIVGGGILALAGTAFASAGPAAIVAFGLNGLIALATAFSFACMARAFPRSGGSYAFAKMVLSVRAAFAVGWVVLFASVVAGVLYAMGFAVYALILAREAFELAGRAPPAWLGSHGAVITLACAATAFYSLNLIRKSAGGGNVETVGKICIFLAFLGAGLWTLLTSGPRAAAPVTFFHQGVPGLVEAMGFTFIALQGFDLIAAVAGEVKDPKRNVPRAMYLSLGIALLVYCPLLLVVMFAGVAPGETVVSMSAAHPDTVVAVAARNMLGAPGFFMIAVAAVLSMLSALQANLFAASRIAQTMARERMLPWQVAATSAARKTPIGGVLASAGLLLAILFVIPDVASAGAAASLIFLVTFALVHWIAFLARRRGTVEVPRWLRWVPPLGGLACISLSAFQGVVVPAAGGIALTWMAIGAVVYLTLFSRRAEAVDASDVARNPLRSQARGENPLVLVPIANPASAEGLVSVADALTPPGIGRVLLLSVVRAPEADDAAPRDPDEARARVEVGQRVLTETLAASLGRGLNPEALITVAGEPWMEIARVARAHGCSSLLLGMSRLSDAERGGRLEGLMSAVDSDVVVLRAPPEWQLSSARRILVPVGGRGPQDELRARLLGSMTRTAQREVTYMRVLTAQAGEAEYARMERELKRFAQGEAPGFNRVVLARSEEPLGEVERECAQADLTVIGVQRLARRKKLFGSFATQILERTAGAVMLISRRG